MYEYIFTYIYEYFHVCFYPILPAVCTVNHLILNKTKSVQMHQMSPSSYTPSFLTLLFFISLSGTLANSFAHFRQNAAASIGVHIAELSLLAASWPPAHTTPAPGRLKLMQPLKSIKKF